MSKLSREQVAEALFRWNTPDNPHFVIRGRAGDVPAEDPYLPIADAVIELFAPVVEAARAEAWDECAVHARELDLVDGTGRNWLFDRNPHRTPGGFAI